MTPILALFLLATCVVAQPWNDPPVATAESPLIFTATSLIQHGEATPGEHTHVPSDRADQYNHWGGWDQLTPRGKEQTTRAAQEATWRVMRGSAFPAGVSVKNNVRLTTAERAHTTLAAAETAAHEGAFAGPRAFITISLSLHIIFYQHFLMNSLLGCLERV
jgi:hypothetical protein